jgi:hypothetical protein
MGAEGAGASARPSLPEAKSDPGPGVSITGVAGSGGAVKVLVENDRTGESRWVAPGGRAFGYSVDYVTPRGGVVSKDGRSQVLELGQNKKAEQPPPAAAKSGSPTPTPKGGSHNEDE